MKRSIKGRGLFYTRDSGGKHETTPGEYVLSAQRRARELDVVFDGNPETITSLIRERGSSSHDVYLDYDVCGNVLSRPGLDALQLRCEKDFSVSHIFIPRRDRLARPDDPVDGLSLELKLQRKGLTLVYLDMMLGPLSKGQRTDIGDLIRGVIDYDRAGQDRRDLAQKIIHAQLALARAGFSTGGRPPYGFRRWLVKTDGTKVRELLDRERVRMFDHHVVWLPVPDDHPHMVIIRRILHLLKTEPASRIARTLTEEGVPTPDFGRKRRDNGIEHFTSNTWSQNTVTSIGRNKLLVAVLSYGKRSMGDQLRCSPTGPRAVVDDDYRFDGKPKVVRNSPEAVQHTKAHFEPPVDIHEHEQLQHTLDARGASQRGKSRSRNPKMNPLGSRVFDMNCAWPMYRVPRGSTYRYSCARYMQSKGNDCDHNHVDGSQATKLVLSSLRQRILNPTLLPKLKKRLRELANAESAKNPGTDKLAADRSQLKQIQSDILKVQRNMALADTPEHHRAIALVYDDLRTQELSLQQRIAHGDAAQKPTYDPESEIAAALDVLDRLPDLATNDENLSPVQEAFQSVNARLFLAFEKRQVKKRILNKVARGIITFGNAPPPVPLYTGPTGRRAYTGITGASVAPSLGGKSALPNQFPGREDNSLGNVSWGNWTAFEPLAGIAEGFVSRFLEEFHSSPVQNMLELVFADTT